VQSRTSRFLPVGGGDPVVLERVTSAAGADEAVAKKEVQIAVSTQVSNAASL